MTDTQKQQNRRCVSRAVMFVVIFLLLFVPMLLLFSNHPDFRIYQMIGGFYEEPEESLDGVYIGSSNCYSFWNPLIAWKNYGITVYPFSCGSLPFYATEYIIRDAVKTQPNALFIVNLNSVDMDDLGMTAIHNVVNYMPESETRNELIDYLGNLIHYSEFEKLEFKFPWIRFRKYWMHYLEKGFFPKPDGLKGTPAYSGYLKKSDDITDAYITTDMRSDIPEELTECLEHLLNYCDEENIRILFVSVPRAEVSESTLGRINTVSDLIRKRGYEVLYLTDLAEDIGLDLVRDYYNVKHTNIHGSIKFTGYLSEYLIENYGLENSRGEQRYSSWDSAWETYAARISSRIPDFETDPTCRDYTLAVPQDLQAEASENGVILRWQAVEGAEQYLIYRKTGSSGTWEAIAAPQSQTSYFDPAGSEYDNLCYTVVPLRVIDGEKRFGNFDYKGVSPQRAH